LLAVIWDAEAFSRHNCRRERPFLSVRAYVRVTAWTGGAWTGFPGTKWCCKHLAS
jgi:hypothetical protein